MDRSKRSLCPNLDSIALRADSVGGIKTYRNTKGTTYDNHPVLEALEFACNPKHLCLTFNLPHPQSEARRRIRIAGPMPGRGGPPGIIPGGAVRIMRGGIGSVNEERLPNFRSRINCLVRGWTRLSSLCCHEVDNEDLPNLTGVKHSYSFASSFRPKETFEIPPRPDPPPGLSPVEQRRSPWQVQCNSAFSQSVPKSSESIAQELQSLHLGLTESTSGKKVAARAASWTFYGAFDVAEGANREETESRNRINEVFAEAATRFS